MEKPSFKTPEQREAEIDSMVESLAEREGMGVEDIISDLATFAPYEGNEDPNPDYIEQMAEMLSIPVEEMTSYAVKKAGDYFKD